MNIGIVVVGCDYIWIAEVSGKMLRSNFLEWYSINVDIERKTIKEWFPSAMIFDYGSPNLSKDKKEGIDRSIPLSKELAESIFIKGLKRKNSFMNLFNNQGENVQGCDATEDAQRK